MVQLVDLERCVSF
ncbi:TPA: hypothetical protein OB818_004276 [Escherichia coli]|nr:hypothetical protein [Escherichia coli]HBP7574034.1 hypothetical protein [Escherichia coli]HCO8437207.1 hypothetical protein [Escherichia coli]